MIKDLLMMFLGYKIGGITLDRKPKRGKSLKRHVTLQPLSRHHMIGLHTALKLRRAETSKSKLTIKEIKKELYDFWNPEGQEHFREEEEILLTAYAQHASIDQPEIREMLIEHVQIRALIDTILKAVKPDVSAMHELGTLLDVHIRKEERIIFPMIEKALPEEVLKELAPYLH